MILLSSELVHVQIKYNISSVQIGSSDEDASITIVDNSSIISDGGLIIEIIGLRLFNLKGKQV